MRLILRAWGSSFGCLKIALQSAWVVFGVIALTILLAFPTRANAAEEMGASEEPAPSKIILFLGGGERSPWFQLGVLYAVEEYGIPVDSIVATSWGAWMGALWSKGVPLDEIQKIMRDSTIAPYVGYDLSSPGNRRGIQERDPYELPISISGNPSIRQRFTFAKDGEGNIVRSKKSLTPDSFQVHRALAKLRFQESLYRQRSEFKIPFDVQGCRAGSPVIIGNSLEDVIASLPLWRDSDDSPLLDKQSGELCPYYALPAEDNASEFPIIVVSDPLRGSFTGDVREQLLKVQASETLASQPGLVVRAHTILDSSRTTWMQAGFTAFEKHLSTLRELRRPKKDYATDRQAALPWFRFEHSFDSLSPKIHNVAKAYWNESDTGIVAPKNFALQLAQNPVYDSLIFRMQPSGHLLLDASAHPTFDVAVGGFGSNVIGPNAYVEADLYYVDKMEWMLSLSGFWGGSSYGVQPRLSISKLWNRHWGLQVGYDYLMLRPLKSFNNEMHQSLRIESEERRDFVMSLLYDIDETQRVSMDFLLGRRTFELGQQYYGGDTIKTYPVSPLLRYRYLTGDENPWFAEKGLAFNVAAGFESIGFDAGIIDVIPIYWKILGGARFSYSPIPFATFTAAAAGAIERYHDEGHGYVSPKSFEIKPLDMVYRQQAAATPWTTEWYNPELSSHEYGLIRGSAAIHSRYFGLWMFAAYYHDFENSPIATLGVDKFVFEPALRFAYRSLVAYAGVNKIVDTDSFDALKKTSTYNYFIRIGNYEF